MERGQGTIFSALLLTFGYLYPPSARIGRDHVIA
jgi:hypothetical protein